jgi:hypothetical protein
MDQSLQGTSARLANYPLNRPWKFLDILRGANSRLRALTAIAVAIAWIPTAVLSAAHGGASFVSFLTDYASQSRFLIVIPVLILAVPGLDRLHSLVAHHLEEFVPENQLAVFQAGWASFEKLRDSRAAQTIIVLLTYALAIWFGEYLSPQGSEVLPWLKGSGGFRWFSPAATWGLFISYPLVTYVALLWLWRQLLWARFMRSTARLDLRIIAAHPDCLGGIGFVGYALRGQHAFCFCLGVGMSGAVANRVFHHGEKLTAFGPAAAVLIGAILLICVVPYFVFTPILMQMRRRGLLKYGSVARQAGERFEKEWLDRPGGVDPDCLDARHFSALNHLYGVVGNVNEISVLPVTRIDLYGLLVAAFIPAIPVVIGSIPLDTIMRAAMKMLF